ncbi:sugar nucleotide-binding protein [Kribbella solani]|uniref:SDR family oxidoreductase n=1 Tax=Kribbella solani TaxID=236067 RepID=UPI0029A1E847|nr:sugar nucleotide-binding protein [Kribbella solani]MDX3005437.1 sugar nucleotide-binding protein [Kribbella solani]
MRLLVTGAAGLLGRELLRSGPRCGHEVVPAYHSAVVAGGVRLDVRRRDAVREVIRTVRPDGIIHAAYRQDDWATTADGAVNVALEADGARLVFVSSDAVFSSRESRWTEDEPPRPETAYGAAKAAAETAIRALTPAAVIARTSIIVGSDGTSGEELRAHRLAGGEPGSFFTDNIRCPVHVADLAAALLELLGSRISGVAHLAGPEALSRYQLGRLIAIRDGLDPDALPSTPGVPSNILLDAQRTQAAITTRLRPPSEFLAHRAAVPKNR